MRKGGILQGNKGLLTSEAMRVVPRLRKGVGVGILEGEGEGVFQWGSKNPGRRHGKLQMTERDIILRTQSGGGG